VAIDNAASYTPELDLRARPMTRRRIAIPTFALLLITAGGTGLASAPPPISGVVRHHEVPVPGVLVIFYNLGDSSMTRLRTAADGTFVLASAPAGVYDLIAYKRGFEPALQRLWHQAASEQVSAVSIALLRKDGKLPAAAPPATIWDLRGRLPSDVLRELGLEGIEEDGSDSDSREPAIAVADRVPLSSLVNGEVRTTTEVAAQSASGSLSRAAVGLNGGLPNGWRYGIAGDYATLGNADQPGETTTGNAAGLA
jgi:hypothetical protein